MHDKTMHDNNRCIKSGLSALIKRCMPGQNINTAFSDKYLRRPVVAVLHRYGHSYRLINLPSRQITPALQRVQSDRSVMLP